MSEENNISSMPKAEADEMQGALKEAGDQIQEVNKGIVESFKEMSERIKECIAQIKEQASSSVQNAGDQAGKLVTTVGGITKGFNDLFDVLSEDDIERFGKLNSAFEKLSGSGGEIKSAFGNISNAFSSLRQGGGGVASAASSLMSAVPGLVNPAMAAVNVATEAFKQMKVFADYSAKATVSAKEFGQSLGLSATKASAVQFALKGMGGDSESYAKAVQHVDEQLHENEGLLKSMGVQTRGANGQLRDAKSVTVEVAQALEKYKEGLERNTMSQKALGVATKDSENIAKLSNETLKEARERQESLGLVIGKDNVEAQEKYEVAMHSMEDVTNGMQKTIGDVVMPVVTDMGEWFASVGPTAVTATRGAVGGLTAVFWGLRNALVIVWEVSKALVKSLWEGFIGVGEALIKVFQGDFSGAAQSLKTHSDNMVGVWNDAMGKMVASSEKTQEEIGKAFIRPSEDSVEPSKKGKNRKGGKKSSGAGGYASADDMEKALAQIKAEEEVVNKKYEIHLISDQQLLEKQEEFANRRYDVELKALMKEMTLTQSRPEKHKEVLARIVALETKHKKDLEAIQSQKKGEKKNDPEADALREVEIDEQIAQIQLNNKIIDQKKMLELEEQFENRRYEIKLKGMKERMALASKEGNGDEQKKLAKDEEALEKAHQAKLKDLKKRGAQEDKSVMFTAMKELGSKLGDVWESHIEKLIKGGFKWRNVYKDSVSAVRTWFLSNIKKMATQWISSEESKTGATLAGIATRNAAEVAAAAKSMAIWAASAIKNILNLAWEAMAATYTAFASMGPWGAALGVAAAAGAFALVSGMAGNVASASGGYDIPAGVNPMTQLHEQEMVLPAHIANPLRSMIASGSESGGGGGDTHVHISAVDAKSVKRLLRDNGRAITDAVKGAVKDGYRA